jgi:glycosyltransferase involved in cell wall biosynthesis
MTAPLYVLIAACGQPTLLRRTLRSLAVCEKPANYAGVIIAENGPPAGLEEVVTEFSPAYRFEYHYSDPPNKSLALNRALLQIPGSLVVFTDDDVQVPPQTLLAYAEAAKGKQCGAFYGGPIIPDHEGPPPPDWLVPLLPRSAGGWRMATEIAAEITRPEFIGPNLAAFAADVLRVGGFDTRLGPGRHMASPGEDTEIQERLLAVGVRGYYLPGAAMRHLVKVGCASEKFAINRAERNGVYWGISQSRQAGFFPRRWLKTYGQWLNDRWRIRRWQRSVDYAEQVKAACWEARWRGRWEGIRLGWNWQPAGGARIGGTLNQELARRAA